MDSNEEQATQATQNVIDPRRFGKQNSGFSDDDIADIICLLVPYSDSARDELKRIAASRPQHTVGRTHTDCLSLDYSSEDDARRFAQLTNDVGSHHIALRFSACLKDPARGFAFGRNPARCDICFENDPKRRLSNIHFRIYLNEHATLMLEDQSTNGTVVDDKLLKAKAKPPTKETQRILNSGSQIRILMHKETSDLVFTVRIPLREGRDQDAYLRNFVAYMGRLEEAANQTIIPGPGGHVDLFKPLTRKTQDFLPISVNHNLAKTWRGSDEYHLQGEIGKGAFATVYKVTNRYTGVPYAAKELDKQKFIKNGVLDQKVANEMKIMRQVQHPNIVQYIKHIDYGDTLLIIIMEHVGGGDLGKLINDNSPLNEVATKTMATQLLDALDYLHSRNITHRDVKPDNILVSSQNPFVVKLTDFGLSKMVDSEQTFLRTFCGTLLYCAPEVYSEYAEYDEFGWRHPRNRPRKGLAGQGYGHAVDIWSLGGVLFFALTKKPPFPAKNGISYTELLHKIMTQPLDTTPLREFGISADGIDFIHRMLDRRPESRATTQDLKAHPWLADSGLALRPKASQLEDELQQSASQLSLQDRPNMESLIDPGDSDDEILTEDDHEQEDEMDPDSEMDEGYLSEESQKENKNHVSGPPEPTVAAPRLFGEINASALLCPGPIPPERLNVPVVQGLAADSRAAMESLDAESILNGSFFNSSRDSNTPRENPKSQPNSQFQSPPGLNESLISCGQSLFLDNMSELHTQSLDGAESFLGNLNMKSLGGSRLMAATAAAATDVNTSKRKSFAGSEDSDVLPVFDRPIIKRFRSDLSIQSVDDASDSSSDLDEDECELLACIPSIMLAQSTRQIDEPVHKSTYWAASDRKSWHLCYPEMTTRQHDMFMRAASKRGEEFAVNKTPLFPLAMKHFPPAHYEAAVGQQSFAVESVSREDSGKTTLTQRTGTDFIPDTQIEVLPERPCAPPDPRRRRIVAELTSSSDSVLQAISIPVTEAFVSWGRAPQNSRSYAAKAESRVPKHAFKIMLWKEGYDTSRDFRPWNRLPPPETSAALLLFPQAGDEGAATAEQRRQQQREQEAASYHFYIATKATAGIRINGAHLASHEPRQPAAACKHWMRLHDGDAVDVWEGNGRVTRLTFRCAWGGSSTPRKMDAKDDAEPAGDENRDPKSWMPSTSEHGPFHPRSRTCSSSPTPPPPPPLPPLSSASDQQQKHPPPPPPPPELVSDAMAWRLDEACARAEKKIRSLSEHDLKMQEADHDAEERARTVDRERERSRRFEKRRVAALRELGRLGGLRRGKKGWGSGGGGGGVYYTTTTPNANSTTAAGYRRDLPSGKAVDYGSGGARIAAGAAGA